MMADGVVVDSIGGMCPVQAEGTIDGQPFYFRSRGAFWSMSIGGADVVGEPDWYYDEPYGEWLDAGYIEVEEALWFVDRAVMLYRQRDIAQGSPAA